MVEAAHAVIGTDRPESAVAGRANARTALDGIVELVRIQQIEDFFMEKGAIHAALQFRAGQVLPRPIDHGG